LKAQVWIAVSVYDLVAIVSKRLETEPNPHKHSFRRRAFYRCITAPAPNSATDNPQTVDSTRFLAGHDYYKASAEYKLDLNSVGWVYTSRDAGREGNSGPQ
jgi:hypothetical protein